MNIHEHHAKIVQEANIERAKTRLESITLQIYTAYIASGRDCSMGYAVAAAKELIDLLDKEQKP